MHLSNDHQLDFCFFDVTAKLRADSKQYLDLFRMLYPRFQEFQPNKETPNGVDFRIISHPKGGYDSPVLIINGISRRLRDERLLEDYLYTVITNTILAEVRSHYLIHAGVVAQNGSGVLFVGDSGLGKTTLTLELVRRGFKFLSDEIAAVGRQDGKVYPFPRSVRINSKTLALIQSLGAAQAAFSWRGKYILDIEAIFPGTLGKTSAINHIFVLTDSKASSAPESDNPAVLSVVIDRITEHFTTTLRSTDGIQNIKVSYHGEYPVLHIETSHKMGALAKVEALCQAEGIFVLDYLKRRPSVPNFDAPVQVTRIPNSEATMAMIQGFLSGHHSVILKDLFNNSPARLFLELSTIIQPAECHRISVGPLDEMSEQILTIIRS